MTTTTPAVHQVVVLELPHQPLTAAMQQAGLFGSALPPRYGVQVRDPATRRARLRR